MFWKILGVLSLIVCAFGYVAAFGNPLVQVAQQQPARAGRVVLGTPEIESSPQASPTVPDHAATISVLQAADVALQKTVAANERAQVAATQFVLGQTATVYNSQISAAGTSAAMTRTAAPSAGTATAVRQATEDAIVLVQATTQKEILDATQNAPQLIKNIAAAQDAATFWWLNGAIIAVALVVALCIGVGVLLTGLWRYSYRYQPQTGQQTEDYGSEEIISPPGDWKKFRLFAEYAIKDDSNLGTISQERNCGVYNRDEYAPVLLYLESRHFLEDDAGNNRKRLNAVGKNAVVAWIVVYDQKQAISTPPPTSDVSESPLIRNSKPSDGNERGGEAA